MDNVDNIIVVISSLISAVLILIYYLNPKHSTCFDCKESISHHKEKRFCISVNGEDHALCKKCFDKRQKQEALPVQKCSCCSKSFTTRMKIHE